MVKLFDLIKYGKEKLQNSNTPQLDAEVILGYILNEERLYLYLNRDKPIYEDQEAQYKNFIERRSLGEPIAYITGTREFMGLDFKVRPGVLIPRPDTEILVQEVINRINYIKKPIITDIGCGSGAIAITLAKYLKDSTIFALDIMDTPLQVTTHNAELHGIKNRVNILKSDLLESLPIELKNNIDVIVSNPPYIEEAVISTLMPDVKDYEPISALSGGIDGLTFYKKITGQAIEFLKNGGLLAYEIGYNQGWAVSEIMKLSGFQKVECIKDFGGNDRVVLGYNSK